MNMPTSIITCITFVFIFLHWCIYIKFNDFKSVIIEWRTKCRGCRKGR